MKAFLAAATILLLGVIVCLPTQANAQANTENRLKEFIKATIPKKVDDGWWSEGDRVTGAGGGANNSHCTVTLFADGVDVQRIKKRTYQVAFWFDTATNCDASSSGVVKDCTCNTKPVSVKALIRLSSNNRIELLKKSINVDGSACSCLHGTRGIGVIRDNFHTTLHGQRMD